MASARDAFDAALVLSSCLPGMAGWVHGSQIARFVRTTHPQRCCMIQFIRRRKKLTAPAGTLPFLLCRNVFLDECRYVFAPVLAHLWLWRFICHENRVASLQELQSEIRIPKAEN